MLIQFDKSKIEEVIRNTLDKDLFWENAPERKEDLSRVFDYLPELFADDSEDEYIRALQLATETSFENRLFQFAYIQYHMLFMTSIYYALLKLSEIHKDEFEKAIFYLLKDRQSDLYKSSNTKGGKLYFGSFAIIHESDVFMLLRAVGLDSSLLGELQKRVENRNKYAHANGQMLLTSEDVFWDEIKEYNKCLQRVFELFKTDIINLYKDTISNSEFFDPEVRAYMDADEQILQEFVKVYSLSRVELNWLRKIKTSEFKDYDGYEHIKDLHIALCHYYTLLIQDDENYYPIEDVYYHHKYQDKADEFVEKELGINGYECIKDGGEVPVYDCPECGHDQLAYDAEVDKYHCFHCGVDYSVEQISKCTRCNRLMVGTEESVCSSCVEVLMND